ncbi:MAG: amino acid permease [Bacteroidales bacterium]|nr:amino acid permease [Bacteroidales bacterium]
MTSAKKKYGLWTASAFVVANMIGTGVFTSLGFQLEATDNFIAILILWAVGGVIALCGAVSYGELGSLFPHSGGEYFYLGHIYSPLFGFLAGWVSLVIGFAAPVALACIALGHYVDDVFPSIPPEVISVGALTLITLIHAFTLKVSGIAQNALTWLKVAIILAFIVLGFTVPDHLESIRPSVTGFDWKVLFSAPFAVSIIWVYYAYSGWNASAYIANDIEKPQKTLPVSLLLSTLGVTVIYMLLNFVFLLTAPVAEMKGQVEVGLISASHILGPNMGMAMGLVIAFMLCSSISSMVFIGPRISQAMGEEHPMLRFLQRKTRAGVPWAGLLFQYALSLIMILTGGFSLVTRYTGVLLSLSSMMAVAGVIVCRHTRKNQARPFRSPLYPVPQVLFILLMLVSIVYAVAEDWKVAVVSAGTIVAGILFYLVEQKFFKR